MVLEVALAYNFVTPYTAFLAIPESEMGDQRGTIEAERERKRKIMANHQDAADLEKDKSPDKNVDRSGLGTSVATRSPVQKAPPPPPAPGNIDARDSSGEDEEEELAMKGPKRMAKADNDDEADAEPPRGEVISASGSESRRGRGCAGCATGNDPTWLLGLALGALMLRRRRR